MKITLNKIAELAKVSRGTVDRAIHNRPGVNKKVRKQILEIIDTLNYTPNPAAKALVSRNSHIRFGVILAPDFHPFVEELREGIQTETERINAFGVDVEIEVTRTLNAEAQLEILERLKKRSISGLAIVPVVQDSISQCLNELAKKDIPIVTFNSDIKGTLRLSFVGQNNHKAGRTACGLMQKILPRNSTVAVITSSMELDCHRNRLGGFRSRLEESGFPFKIISIDENQDRDDLAFDTVMHYAEKHPHLSGIYLTGGGANGLGKGLKITNLHKTVKVITHDTVPAVIELMREGIVSFTIGQNPHQQGALPIRILFDYVFRKKKPDRDVYYTGIDIHTVDSLEIDR